jgi:hypothetical protein
MGIGIVQCGVDGIYSMGLVYTALDLSTMGTKLLALSQGIESQSITPPTNCPYTLFVGIS